MLFLSVLIVNQTLSDGRSKWVLGPLAMISHMLTRSWMEGLVLMFLYLIIAVSFWYYPVGRDTIMRCQAKLMDRAQTRPPCSAAEARSASGDRGAEESDCRVSEMDHTRSSQTRMHIYNTSYTPTRRPAISCNWADANKHPPSSLLSTCGPRRSVFSGRRICPVAVKAS